MMNPTGSKKTTHPRRLQAESLENRQLLHGGGFGGILTLEDWVQAAFQRLDSNADGQLASDEVPADAWTKLSGADTNTDGGISSDELLTLLQDAMSPAGPQSGHFEGHRHRGSGHGERHEGKNAELTVAERVDKLFEIAGDDELLSESEVSACVWTRIADADADGNGLISKDELTSQLEAEAEARLTAIIDNVFVADQNGDGLTADEVSARKWERLSTADADGDGIVSQDELRTYLETKRTTDETDASNGGTATDSDSDDQGDVPMAAVSATPYARPVRAGHSFGRRR